MHKNVIPYELVVGNPIRRLKNICKCGNEIMFHPNKDKKCKQCGISMNDICKLRNKK